MHRIILTSVLALAALAAGCRSRGSSAEAVKDGDAASPAPTSAGMTSSAAIGTPVVTPPAPPAAEPLPASVDLRPRLLTMGLAPRPQGRRGTCSVFTTCVALEFALAVQAERSGASGPAARLSPEYLNWAGAQVVGRPCDGNFFHNAVAGFERWGLCTEASMPYADVYDPARTPSATAAEEARAVRERATGHVIVRWIVPWTPDRFGVNEDQFAEIKRTLARGYPVAAGSGHSRLLVGYRDDAESAAANGGGVFLTLDSALNRFAEVPFAFVRKDVADVFWVECVEHRNGAGNDGSVKRAAPHAEPTRP